MRIRTSITIAADAATVWPFIADPVLQADWNPKIVSVGRDAKGPVQSGERFEMIYRMSGRENQSEVLVLVAEPPHRVVFMHRSTWKSVEQTVEEIYEITPQRSGVKVLQTIDLSGAHIPWLFSLLIWFIQRFGKSVEASYLMRLKQIIERRTAC